MNPIVETRTLKTENFLYLACVVLSMLVVMASIRIGSHSKQSLFWFLETCTNMPPPLLRNNIRTINRVCDIIEMALYFTRMCTKASII